MYKIRHLLAIIGIALVFTGALSSCGQKGPLVLPQEDTSPTSELQDQ